MGGLARLARRYHDFGMSELIEYPTLARDRLGRHFAPPEEAIAWRGERATWGRPFSVAKEGRMVLVDLYATVQELEEAYGYAPGIYKLTMVNAQGEDVDGPVAYIEIHARNLGSESQQYGLERAFMLCDRMAQSNEHKDRMMSEMMKALMHTHVQLQQGAASLLEASNTSTRVANGIERIERQPPVVDVEFITEHVVAAIDERQSAKSDGPQHWVIQLMNGPVGMAAMQILNGVAQSAAQAHNKKNRKPDTEE